MMENQGTLTESLTMFHHTSIVRMLSTSLGSLPAAALPISTLNQASFKMYPETVTNTMNKEDIHSHLLPVKLWVMHFLPWCRHTAQGILVKPGKTPL
jgi:hypothetical protein